MEVLKFKVEGWKSVTGCSYVPAQFIGNYYCRFQCKYHKDYDGIASKVYCNHEKETDKKEESKED